MKTDKPRGNAKMTSGKVDIEKLRVSLRRMKRNDLLAFAERAIELVPKTKLQTLVGDRIRLEDLAPGPRGAGGLLEEVRRFHAASLAGPYYESFNVNSKNFMDKSEGTEEFIAEFDRLIAQCVRAANMRPQAPVREGFELLFALLRQIDGDPDSIVFFADEADSWQIDVDWRTTLPAYFQCLATSSGEEFAREADRAITDFANYERPTLLTAARRVANTEQKAALQRLRARSKAAEKGAGR